MQIRLAMFRIALTVAITCAAASDSWGQFRVQRDVHVYNTKRSFFQRSGFGALALTPNVTSKPQAVIASEYITLPASGRYDISRRRAPHGDWWFIVNHRSGAEVSERHTYVGVFVAKRLEFPLASSLQLIRNAGWRELDGVELGAFENTYESWTEFFDLQDASVSQGAFEQRFGDWHAIPDPRTDESSWVHRRNWHSASRVSDCFEAIGGERASGSNVFFQAILIRFQVTSESNSRYPVAWSIGLRDADALFLKTFSPEGIDLAGEYCVEIS